MNNEELVKNIEEDVIKVIELEPTPSNPYVAVGIAVGALVVAGASYLGYKVFKKHKAAKKEAGVEEENIENLDNEDDFDEE